MMDFRIGKVGAADVKVLQKISRETFFEAFQAVNTPEDMAAHLDAAYAEEKLQRELADEASAFYFVKSGDEVAGYIKVNFAGAQSDMNDPDSLELERIYVSSSFQGRGVGQVLMDKAIEIAQNRNKKYIWLGVWERNPGAIRFYERNGFRAFGEHTFVVGSDPQTDVLMRLDLPPNL